MHPARKPGTERAASLQAVDLPMLFLQGDRDPLANLDLLTPICTNIGASLHVIETADHSFKVLKRSGRSFEAVNQELAQVAARWADQL